MRKPVNHRVVTHPLSILLALALVTMLCVLPYHASADEIRVVPKKQAGIPSLGRRASTAGMNDIWYLAEGSTAWGFGTWLQIENPNDIDVTARITYMLDDGTSRVREFTLAAASLTWVNPYDDLGERDFSTMVQCLDVQPIAVSRVMTLGFESESDGCMHASIGTVAPSKMWYLPEGTTGGDFETFVLVQNPNNNATDVSLTYMTPNGSVAGPKVSLPAHARRTFNVSATLPDEWSVSTRVDSTQLPVIAERATYWGANGSRVGGHESMGTFETSTYWYLAEGSTGGDFETWVLVMNPNAASTDVNFDFYTDTGKKAGPKITLGPNERRTVNVAQYQPNQWNISTAVRATRKIVAERAMYGNNRAWGHDSVGMTAPHSMIFLPFGQTGPDVNDPRYDSQTWTLVQNPSTVAVTIRLVYLTEDGTDNVVIRDDTLPPGSRKSYPMSAVATPGELAIAGVMVLCKDSGQKVMAENSTYLTFNGARFAGSNNIGGFLDE